MRNTKGIKECNWLIVNANSAPSDHTPRKLTAPASLVEVGYFFDLFGFDGWAIVE
jgi:hypothetical protein